ncbi:LysR family transcriptional regulator [Rhizorhabdus wittichii DC-6]|nr:LysR family transcriptional regulator [Rhizorhabdus wittichii DC-6]
MPPLFIWALFIWGQADRGYKIRRRGAALTENARTGSKRDLTAGFLRNYDLVSLRLLLAAIEEGNLAKVAAQENISLSAVSRRISDLEGRIGVKLLQRHDRGVSPTDAAIASLPRLRGVFDLIDRMAEDFAEVSAGTRGVVRVRAHLTAIIGRLPERIASFTAAHPGIDIVVDEANSPDVVHALQVGGCDLGFVSGTIDTASLDIFPWMVDELVVVMRDDHALSGQERLRFEQLLDHPFIGMATGSSLHTLLRGQAAALGRPLDEVARVSTFEGVREMVAAGMGVGILPSAAVARVAAAQGIAVRGLDEPWAERPLVICARDRAQLSAAARKFLDHLLDGQAPKRG